MKVEANTLLDVANLASQSQTVRNTVAQSTTSIANAAAPVVGGAAIAGAQAVGVPVAGFLASVSGPGAGAATLLAAVNPAVLGGIVIVGGCAAAIGLLDEVFDLGLFD